MSAHAIARWGKRFLKLVLVLIVVFALTIGAFSLSQAGRAALGRNFIRFANAWSLHWPFARGGYIVYRFAPVMRTVGAIPVRFDLEPGVTFLLDPIYDDLQRTILLAHGGWQAGVWRSLSADLREGAVFLDLGAHVGYFSLRASPKIGKTGRVIAFEPNPDTLKELRANIRASHASNIVVQPIACTDAEQTLTLYSDRDHPAGASLSSANAGSKGGRFSYTVRGRRVDDVIRELGLTRVDVVKVDVEGAEFFVLKGALETLKRFHPKVVVEIMPANLANMNTKPEDIFRLMQEAGYTKSRQVDDDDWEWTAR